MDSFDTSSAVKSNKDLLGVVTGPDDDLEHLLFHTVDAQIKVSSTNKTNGRQQPGRTSTRLQSDSTEFGETWNQGTDLVLGFSSIFSIVIAEYPWQVAILKKEEFDNVYICGGSLIDGSHILTAAHCIKDYKPQDIR